MPSASFSSSEMRSSSHCSAPSHAYTASPHPRSLVSAARRLDPVEPLLLDSARFSRRLFTTQLGRQLPLCPVGRVVSVTTKGP
eukprot:1906339-Pyramimonas_sp.AAC.1